MRRLGKDKNFVCVDEGMLPLHLRQDHVHWFLKRCESIFSDGRPSWYIETNRRLSQTSSRRRLFCPSHPTNSRSLRGMLIKPPCHLMSQCTRPSLGLGSCPWPWQESADNGLHNNGNISVVLWDKYYWRWPLCERGAHHPCFDHLINFFLLENALAETALQGVAWIGAVFRGNKLIWCFATDICSNWTSHTALNLSIFHRILVLKMS